MLSDWVFGDAQNHAGSGLLEVMLIVVPIKEALELQKYFVKAIAKFSVARMVCLSSDVALKVLDIIK